MADAVVNCQSNPDNVSLEDSSPCSPEKSSVSSHNDTSDADKCEHEHGEDTICPDLGDSVSSHRDIQIDRDEPHSDNGNVDNGSYNDNDAADDNDDEDDGPACDDKAGNHIRSTRTEIPDGGWGWVCVISVAAISFIGISLAHVSLLFIHLTITIFAKEGDAFSHLCLFDFLCV